jgi:hypothetical protein
MKKILSIIAFVALVAGISSCETYNVEEPDMTAIYKVDGKYVGFAFNVDDPTDTLSVVAVTITNTTDNASDRAWMTVIDMNVFSPYAMNNWQRLFAVRFAVSVSGQSFSANAVEAKEPTTAWHPYIEGLYGSYGSYYTVGRQRGRLNNVYSATVDGSVVTDGVNTASGYKTDKLEFTFTLDIPEGQTNITAGTVTYKFVGMKKTGWAEDTQEYMDFCDSYLW